MWFDEICELRVLEPHVFKMEHLLLVSLITIIGEILKIQQKKADLILYWNDYNFFQSSYFVFINKCMMRIFKKRYTKVWCINKICFDAQIAKKIDIYSMRESDTTIYLLVWILHLGLYLQLSLNFEGFFLF